jgi:sn-glycerol 3-phosphate transport system permease protein
MGGLVVGLLMLTAALGAMVMAIAFRRRRRSAGIGALVGAIAAAVGSLSLMVPLGFCTFSAERSLLDQGFGVVLVLLGAAMALGIVNWLLMLIGGDRSHRLGSEPVVPGQFKTHWSVPLLLLAPTLLILLIFIYYPALDTFSLATRLARLSTPRTQFVCVRNFTELIDPSYRGQDLVVMGITALLGYGVFYSRQRGFAESRLYWLGQRLLWAGAIASSYLLVMGLWSDYYHLIFFNTVWVAVFTVGIGLAVSLGLAVLAYQPIQGAGIYRTLLIWSYAISPAVAGVIFAIMFNPVVGVVNHILVTVFHTSALPWLTNPFLARCVLILASIWKQLGYNILFYIAGLQTVPQDLLEAATLDGANRWQRFLNVILPALSPITFFLIITNLTYTFFDVYGTIDYLTKGGPNGATSVAIYEIIRVGIRSDRDLGRAAAQSIILFLMVIGVTLVQFRTSGRRVNYGA